MRFLSSILSVTIAVSLLVGCSSNTATPIASLPNVGTRSLLDSPTRVNGRGGLPAKPEILQNWYVADLTGNDVSVYDHSGNFKYSISGLDGPDFVTFDSSENLYVANLKGNAVDVYAPGQTSPKLALSNKISQPTAVAIGSAGNIYVANAGNNTVTIYDQSGTWLQTLSQTKDNVDLPQALAFDGNGYLYVANGATTTHHTGSVTVYTGAPPHRTLKRTITQNVNNPRALLFDGSDDLFVANEVSAPVGTVTKYLPYAKDSSYSETYGKNVLSDPNALAFDSFGHLCVSNFNSVVCFINPTTIYKTLTPKDGINNPVSFAVGPTSGWLKVANDFSPGSVTQYCPQKTCPAPTPTPITENMGTPVSIAVGP